MLQTSAANTGLSDSSGVSVIIPAHNAEAALEATLNSMDHQTHAVWEAVTINDGSTDGTRALAEDWARRDQRFQLHLRYGVLAVHRKDKLDAVSRLRHEVISVDSR